MYVSFRALRRIDSEKTGLNRIKTMTRKRAYAGIALKLVTGFLAPGLAVAATFADWEASTDGAGSFWAAATVNRSQEVFGEWCYADKGTCIWLIGMTTRCNEGKTYRVLANSDIGAVQLEVRCLGKLEVTGAYELAFTKFDDVDHIARKASRVGFAIPLRTNQVRVARFSLSGAVRALTAMREAASSASRKAKKQRIPSETL
jgi:hypothetical protein